MQPRPILTPDEMLDVRQALRLTLNPGASEEAIAREWAQHWWDNHATSFYHGDPVEAVAGVQVTKLHDIARHYECDYRHMLDRAD